MYHIENALHFTIRLLRALTYDYNDKMVDIFTPSYRLEIGSYFVGSRSNLEEVQVHRSVVPM